MQHNKLSITAAVVAALVFPGVALAATDDMGMQYTSASEGLSGSFRVNLYNSSDNGTVDTTSGASLDSLRLYINGSADLGNGLSSTYGLELRPAGGVGIINTTHSYHVGLNGVFGSLQFGRIAGAGFMVPGGSLDSIKGNSRKQPTEDPGDQTFKFTSPNINGLQFGFSAIMNDTGIEANDDDLLDEVAFAATYDTPLGLKLGAAYEKEAKSTNVCVDILVTCPADSADFGEVVSKDDITGYRFGAHYGQDNWTVAYEFRTYDNFSGGIVGPAFGAKAASLTTSNGTVFIGHGGTGNDYQVHGFAVRFNLDKVTASANYSAEEVSFDTVGTGNNAKTPKDLGRTALGVDVKYALGSKSSILLGFSSTETDKHASDFEKLDGSTDEDSTTIRYQVDF